MIFYVPGEPKGKGRPRFGKGQTYTPEATVSYEQYVKYCFAEAAEDAGYETAAGDVPVIVMIEAFFEPPSSWPKKKRAAALNKEYKPTRKPDCDNIIKIILDALNGLAYKDDKQVVYVVCAKEYAAEANVKVTICPLASPTDLGIGEKAKAVEV